MGKVWKYIAIAAGAWILVRAFRPKWYDDLMLRAFASDQIAEPGKTPEDRKRFEEAADIAARALLPLGWVLKLAEVYSGTTLEQAAQKVKSQVLASGPPADSKPETLAKYRADAINAGKV
jgi:hypothetical protein